jgi:hypothetical protein
MLFENDFSHGTVKNNYFNCAFIQHSFLFLDFISPSFHIAKHRHYELGELAVLRFAGECAHCDGSDRGH